MKPVQIRQALREAGYRLTSTPDPDHFQRTIGELSSMIIVFTRAPKEPARWFCTATKVDAEISAVFTVAEDEFDVELIHHYELKLMKALDLLEAP